MGREESEQWPVASEAALTVVTVVAPVRYGSSAVEELMAAFTLNERVTTGRPASSMTVMIVPRKLMRPRTVSGAPGSRVMCCMGTISRKASISHAKELPPMLNTRSRRVGT